MPTCCFSTLTVPKLELCGAELQSRLIAEISVQNVFEGRYSTLLLRFHGSETSPPDLILL